MTELDFASPRVEAAARVIAEKLGGPNYGADDWGVFASVARSALDASDKASAERTGKSIEEVMMASPDEWRAIQLADAPLGGE